MGNLLNNDHTVKQQNICQLFQIVETHQQCENIFTNKLRELSGKALILFCLKREYTP